MSNATLSIEPRGVYDDGTLVLALGVTHATLARARRDGHLRFAREGRQVLYLGQWILEWIEQSAAGRIARKQEVCRDGG